ncbi:ATP-dependent RNA helicase DBP8 [Salinomyces thailandicus]|uniref:ATP-dependent RNA helicase DBP8 n=1 Tax=Salinomyces thailandicus TaxID=706561 RepID=A0A4U0U919_9PEZI|nr:ATP-dependent RNA helicase DBP8 [Salinomyces thailandica]
MIPLETQDHNLERPTKRRRVSVEYDGSDPSSLSDSDASLAHQSPESSPTPEPGNGGLKSQSKTAPISRIKAKKDEHLAVKSRVLPDDTLPASIQSSIDTSSDATFATLGISPWLVRSLKSLAIKQPTRIQCAAIPPILSGRDCIGGSRTGSGKTVAFAAPILQTWSQDPSGIYAVVLTPTRELALQIYEQIAAIGSRQGIRCCLVTGGADQRTQALELGRLPHIVIATPGRLAEHIQTSGDETMRGLRKVKYVVLDEADRLLATGKGSMLPAVSTCLDALPPSGQRQTLLFTATITPEVRALQDAPRAKGKPPVFSTEVDTDSLTLPPTLHQTYQLVNILHKEKYLHILLLTAANLSKPTIIFCNRTDTATLLEHLLRLLDHRVTALHSGLHHTDRVANLARFRAKAARILIATDVAARGLDIPAISLVINYDLPRNPDDYIHRVGRTARAGRHGTSISLVGQRDVDLVHAIEARVGREMEAYVEEGVNVETRVVRDALNVVGEKKREAVLAIEEGRDVKGKRRTGMKRLMG